MGNAGDLRLMFLREFAGGLVETRERYRRALTEHAPLEDVTRAAGEYCHRMAGVAGMVGFPLVGEVAALCEGFCKLHAQSETVQVQRLIDSALETLAHFFARGDEAAEESRPITPPVRRSKRAPRRHA